jgi:transketolase
MRDAFVQALTALAETDRRIILLTADLGFGVLTDFAARFPSQFLNIGVAEQNMTGVAAGLAMEGRTVFTYSIANFPTLRCLEQIRNDVCYHDANVKIVSIGGGMSYGALGMSHHATEDIAILRTFPNMTVVSPGDRWEALEATRVLAKHPGPAYLRLDKSAAPDAPRAGECFDLNKARKIREGYDVTLATTGGILGEAVEAERSLRAKGISCRVLSIHTVKPLDVDSLAAAARETGGIISIEEHTIDGGLGSAIAENLLERGVIPGFFRRLGLRDGFPGVGSQEYLRKQYGLNSEAIVEAAVSLLRSGQRRKEAVVA